MALPRRPPPDGVELVRFMTDTLRLPDGPCGCAPRPCILELRPMQAAYLWEASQVGGILGHLTVGSGKTLIEILLPMVVDGCKRALLLVPADGRPQLLSDYVHIANHWIVPNLFGVGGVVHADRPMLAVLSFDELSNPRKATWLASYDPDVVIADEAHCLKDWDAVRTRRLFRYIDRHPARCFFHSGTLIGRSIGDYAHLSRYALGQGSPLPLQGGVVEEWCQALDARPRDGFNAPAGALRKLCGPDETPREAVRKRTFETRGALATMDGQLGVPLTLSPRTPRAGIPRGILDALRVARTGVRPDGEELVEAVEVIGCARQIAAGFYLRWKYPRGEPLELIEEWFRRRQAWNRALRVKLEHPEDGEDSPALLRLAADAGRWRPAAFAPWREIEFQVQPVSDAVWLSDYLAQDAADWARSNIGIVWVEHPLLAERVAALAGVDYYGEGKDASEGLLELDKAGPARRSIVASIKAHHKVKNLQHAFSKNFVVEPPASGTMWEQLIGRTHRPGQQADEVTVEVYQHTEELRSAIETAKSHAKFAFELTQAAQKLLYGDWIGAW